MIRPTIFIAISTLGLGACARGAAAAPADATYVQARLVTDLGSAAVATALPPARGSKGKRQSPDPTDEGPGAQSKVPVRRAGARGPIGQFTVGSVRLYPWAEGFLYGLRTAPGQVSDIALQEGEKLVSVAAGDTARWVIGDTTSGTGSTRRIHVLVKPFEAGLKTNLVIATDRRVYHVEVESTRGPATPSIAWTYPDDSLLALQPDAAAGDGAIAAGVAVDTLNFDYRIEGDRPPWRPVRAFDDGRQVFIEFPPAFAQGEAPPLFITGDHGRAELVNYHVRGRYYVVDRLFAAAELRLGERHQEIVRIVREGRGPRGEGTGR